MRFRAQGRVLGVGFCVWGKGLGLYGSMVIRCKGFIAQGFQGPSNWVELESPGPRLGQTWVKPCIFGGIGWFWVDLGRIGCNLVHRAL